MVKKDKQRKDQDNVHSWGSKRHDFANHKKNLFFKVKNIFKIQFFFRNQISKAFYNYLNFYIQLDVRFLLVLYFYAVRPNGEYHAGVCVCTQLNFKVIKITNLYKNKWAKKILTGIFSTSDFLLYLHLPACFEAAERSPWFSELCPEQFPVQCGIMRLCLHPGLLVPAVQETGQVVGLSWGQKGERHWSRWLLDVTQWHAYNTDTRKSYISVFQ